MAENVRILGQADLAATTLTAVYTVPAVTQAVLSSFSICNRAATPTTFRVSFAANGAADSPEQYMYFDLPLAANDTFVATLGITLDAADVVRFFAADADVTAQVFGMEIT